MTIMDRTVPYRLPEESKIQKIMELLERSGLSLVTVHRENRPWGETLCYVVASKVILPKAEELDHYMVCALDDISQDILDDLTIHPDEDQNTPFGKIVLHFLDSFWGMHACSSLYRTMTLYIHGSEESAIAYWKDRKPDFSDQSLAQFS
jgi:hypothetical protein